MTDFNSVIDWHPRFSQCFIAENELVLISEKENYCLCGDQYKDLIKYVDGIKSINCILKEITDFIRSASFLQAIRVFLESNIIKIKKGEHSCYFQKKSVQTFIEPHINSEGQRIYNLSVIGDGIKFINYLKIPKEISLVIVDDYLDPKLRNINQEHLESKTPYIIIKPTGEKPLIGPLFSMKENDPCWQCMSSQMVINQPVRRWVQKRLDNKYIQLPVFFDSRIFDKKWFASVVQQVFKKENTCLELDMVTQTITEHIINHRPQCTHCGNELLIKEQMLSPVVLKKTLKIPGLDGGSRTIKPEETLQRLKNFISPLFGVVINISKVPNQLEGNISIYKSSFFCTPPSTENIDNDSFVQLSLGKGVVEDQSRSSALCESIERYAAQYQGDEYWIESVPEKLKSRYYLPHQLAIFSKKQYEQFKDKKNDKGLSQVVCKYKSSIPIHWVPSWSLTQNENVYLPFAYCFNNVPIEDSQYIRWNSNGAAAGNVKEEAILQGFYEVIERDAAAIWWYNKTHRKEIDLSGLKNQDYNKVRYTLEKDWDYWVLDITTDFNIPVIVAVAHHKKNGEYCFGFGCHLNIEIACLRALTELCQLIPIRDQKDAPFDFKAIKNETYLRGTGQKKSISDYPTIENIDIKEDILVCIDIVKKLGFETLIVDYSRPELPIKTVKVIIPGLCFIWPQLGNSRLYDTPVKLGHKKNKLKEEELNEMGLYV